jgi:hypothetical protein
MTAAGSIPTSATAETGLSFRGIYPITLYPHILT